MPDFLTESLSDAYDDTMLPTPLPADPFPLFQAWFDEAHAKAHQPNPNAMTVATIDPEGTPSARIVLCKAIHPDPGRVVFYTNYKGRKGRALAANPHAAVIFHWDHPDRQVRIEGPVTRSPAEESDAYFKTRAWQSRLGAWASDQSEPIASREKLFEQIEQRAKELGITKEMLADDTAGDIEIPRPPHWGGFRVWAKRVELWCGGTGRVHDRAEWTRELTPAGDEFDAGNWSRTRVQP
ncbi:MAG: pyridoxamine 5'-phosphate oxidase [Planctomycetota bacterium]